MMIIGDILGIFVQKISGLDEGMPFTYSLYTCR